MQDIDTSIDILDSLIAEQVGTRADHQRWSGALRILLQAIDLRNAKINELEAQLQDLTDEEPLIQGDLFADAVSADK